MHEAVVDIITDRQAALLEVWIKLQVDALRRIGASLRRDELRTQSEQFLHHLGQALPSQAPPSPESADWKNVFALLKRMASGRAREGFSATESASFLLCLKKPIYAELTKRAESGAEDLTVAQWEAAELLDTLGLFCAEVYIDSRDAQIRQQRAELAELSSPVVVLHPGILALPLVGTVDSYRAIQIMDALLEAVDSRSADIAIIDITGVPIVDTQVAQHLLKACEAVRLMGSQAILSGVGPSIARTMVHLGVDLRAVVTKSSMAQALAFALEALDLQIVARAAAPGSTTP